MEESEPGRIKKAVAGRDRDQKAEGSRDVVWEGSSMRGGRGEEASFLSFERRINLIVGDYYIIKATIFVGSGDHHDHL